MLAIDSRLRKNRLLRALFVRCFILCSVMLAVSLKAFGQSHFMSDFAAIPEISADSSTSPLVMFVMSRDNQLWHKAYNDYSDLDGDGRLDTTYNDNFEYYGYFHSDFCYRYSQAASIFSPIASVESDTHRCAGNSWSGNFMNWLTTTRIDVVRKVLYGGFRSTDTPSATILQRALVPSDNHAFVKIVRNSEIQGSISDYTPITGQSEVSFCNVTDGTGISATLNTNIYAPLIKVASGSHPSWAGSALRQCMFQDEQGDPAFSPTRPSPGIANLPSNSELTVRVEVCVDGHDRSSCRSYQPRVGGGVSYKPFGLLQTYGESGTYKFGLMTGSYENNIQGGVLRKNIVYMGGASANSNDIEIEPATGQFRSDTNGIINTLNRLRIHGWDFDRAAYWDCNDPGISVSEFVSGVRNAGRASHINIDCRDWGNPISEIYLEALRYLSGASADPSFASSNSDSRFIPGLETAEWEDPYTAETACSDCSIIVLSTGLNNFDGDQLGGAASLPSLGSVGALRASTDRVGAAEGFGRGRYIIGENVAGNGTATAGECDAKSLSSGLSDAQGLCPEAATLRGTFNIAGASFYAHESDIRDGLAGTQGVKTFTVSLAESLPKFEVTTGNGNSVSFVPTCRSLPYGAATEDEDAWIECSLVDLTVVEQTDHYGRFLIAWEDSSWGNDYDMDAYSVIEYCTASGSSEAVQRQCPNYTEEESGDTSYAPHHQRPEWGAAANSHIQMRVSMVGASAGFAMKFGYVMNGSVAGDGSFDEEIYRPGGYDGNSSVLTGAEHSAYYILWSAEALRFESSSQNSPSLLENPLWYAAKYGNFDDLDGDGFPNLVGEWDSRTVSGETGSSCPLPSAEEGCDGIPDAYFPVSNPATLPGALEGILTNISERVSSGSGAAVNSQTGRGEGALYQALFTPRKVGESEESISWVGTLNAIFIDAFGDLREDNPNAGVQGRLDDEDLVIRIRYSEERNETLVQRYSIGSNDLLSPEGDPFPLDDEQFSPIWSAQKQLNNVTSYSEHRENYSSSSGSRRYIFTAFDRDGDGQVIEPQWSAINPGQPASPSGADDGVHPFTPNTFSRSGNSENDFRYLGLNSRAAQQDIDNLVNYIRGVEGIPGFRNRTLDGESFLLGDIVHSSPAVVAKPHARYDLKFGDETYRTFFNAYENRRNVVYVGANDGMLHAFNGGRFDPADLSYSADGHPLGSELWAYVPFNLLPHLRWLASPSYPHVYYMDGPVQAFDVNIFPPSEKHPHGWGTIIVAGMRLGGGDISLDHDDDDTTPNITARSAYVIFDVTDPEDPPELIAEITDEALGYTTSLPTLVKNRQPSNGGSFRSPSQNDWYLVFGSGPGGVDAASKRIGLEDAVSNRATSYAYTFNLNDKTLSRIDLEEPNSFTGGFASGDWNADFQDDAVYFGLVNGTPIMPGGKLMQGRFNSYGSVPSVAINEFYSERNLPFSAVPLTHRSSRGDFWVFAGTGRFVVSKDNLSSQAQSFFGFMDPRSSSELPVLNRDLVDVTEIAVMSDGRVLREGGDRVTLTAGGITNTEIENFGDVRRFVLANDGWMSDFRSPSAPYGEPATYERIRTSTKAAVLAPTTLLYTAYEGSGEFCSSEGTGLLYAAHLEVGLPNVAIFGAEDDRNINVIELGVGNYSSPQASNGVGRPMQPSLPASPRPSPSPSATPEPTCVAGSVSTTSSTGERRNDALMGACAPSGRKSWVEIPVLW